MELVIDPDFKAHFIVPHPTPEYAKLVDCLPDVFVGLHAQLVPLVQLMATEVSTPAQATPRLRYASLQPAEKLQDAALSIITC